MADYVTVAQVTDLSPGRAQVVIANGKRLTLCNVGGTFYAIDDVCTHDGGPLGEGELWGDAIECPRHGARFNVKTGAVVNLPAVIPVNTYPVVVEGDAVKVKV